MTDDQKLWDLLGRAPKPQAPPFFAARVMRSLEAQDGRQPSIWQGVLRWLAPAAVCALAVVALLPRPETGDTDFASSSELTTLDLVEMLSPEDYQILTAAGWSEDGTLLTGSP